MVDGDITKLPRWAQRRIEKLEGDVRYWKGLATVGPDVSDTFAQAVDGDTPLGAERRVKYMMGGEWDSYIEAHTFKDSTGPRYVQVRGARTLSIVPQATNSFRVYLGKR